MFKVHVPYAGEQMEKVDLREEEKQQKPFLFKTITMITNSLYANEKLKIKCTRRWWHIPLLPALGR